ncbi:hypothetical protein T03_13905, partial [Trichinella britovi]
MFHVVDCAFDVSEEVQWSSLAHSRILKCFCLWNLHFRNMLCLKSSICDALNSNEEGYVLQSSLFEIYLKFHIHEFALDFEHFDDELCHGAVN